MARAHEWEGDDRKALFNYLVTAIDWWVASRAAKKSYPSSTPRFARLLTKEKGEVSTHYLHWKSKGMKNDIERFREKR